MPEDPGRPPTGGSPLPGAARRLVVLPLANISAGSRDDYFVDGLTEELISALSKIPGLSVIARTSAMHYKGTDKTIRQVAQELDVRAAVEGSVRRSGRQLRIAVRLIDATSEEELWSESYDRTLEDVFAIQREIARRIGRALKLRLARRDEAEIARAPASVANAHDLYLQGRYAWNLRTEEGLRRAIVLFHEALERDRTFALAWCGIADAWSQLGWLEFSAPSDAFPKAREAAERALALDDRLADAHSSLGFVRFLYERDWAGAEKELKRGIALNPGYPAGHQFFADYLKAVGRFDEALAEMRRALELDPLSMSVNTGFGHVLYLARDFDGAIEQYGRALRIDPTFGPAHLWFGRPYLQKGMYDEAIAEIQQAVASSGGSTISLAVLAHALASAGRSTEAKSILADLLERSRARYLPSYWIALIFTGLGDVDQAMAWLERAYEERSSWLVWINVEPRFDRLRPDPRFGSLLQRMRLGAGGRVEPSGTGPERRLAAIMFTDIVGFTKLTQQDEASALRLLEEHRALLRPLFSARGGREVKTIGDGFLVEFPSAVESVRCAVEIQSAVAHRNASRRPRERFRLRVGVHVGDVVREGDDLVGDGVNLASRIEPLAEPGGICITGPVWDQVRNKVDVTIERLPSVSLKNVSTPVEVYKVR
ncbi:MAG: tetratricopeptide repeat protein [Thermoplasmata archaeon]|nr:tetratricopeptide repeat protein [Thermoplasmata archaeon]